MKEIFLAISQVITVTYLWHLNNENMRYHGNILIEEGFFKYSIKRARGYLDMECLKIIALSQPPETVKEMQTFLVFLKNLDSSEQA